MTLALFPGKAALLFLILFVLAVVTGLLIDRFSSGDKPLPTRLEDSFELHRRRMSSIRTDIITRKEDISAGQEY